MGKLRKLINETPAFFSTVGWCFSMSCKASRFYTIVRIVAETTVPLLIILTAFIGRHLINLLAGVWHVGDSVKVLIFLFSLQLIIALIISGSRKLNQYCQSVHESIFEKELSVSVMENALTADLELFDNADYYDKLQSASRDSYAVMHILWSVVASFSAIVSFATAFVLLSQVNALYGLLMMIAAIPSSIAASKYTKLVYNLSLDQISGQRIMSYYQGVAANKHYAQDIRLYDAGAMLKREYVQKWKELFGERKEITRKRTITTSLLDFIPEIAIVLIGVNVALQIMRGNGTVGDYSLYAGLISQLWSSVNILSMSIMQIYDNQMKIANFKTLSLFETRIDDKGKTRLKEIETIRFDEVSFTYPKSNKSALKNVSFTLRPREKVAVVGLNGSGKSTLIKLLLRMYNPDSGTIYINERNICEYPISEVRRNFSVYFQDMQNYSFTLRKNLSIADNQKICSDEECESAFSESGGVEILNKSPKRLDAHLTRFIESDGIELSGGEYQKVALARTFYRTHTALILDEPSSNLDPEAEDMVFQALRRMSEGKLTLFTSHRLSNSSLADRIMVLEDGEVLEFGTQEELMRNKARYAELFRYQQSKYILPTERS